MKRQVSFTLRFDPALYGRIKEYSRTEGTSVSAFVQEAVAAKLARKETAALYDAFTLVGSDSAESEVEYAVIAQAEAVLRDE